VHASSVSELLLADSLYAHAPSRGALDGLLPQSMCTGVPAIVHITLPEHMTRPLKINMRASDDHVCPPIVIVPVHMPLPTIVVETVPSTFSANVVESSAPPLEFVLTQRPTSGLAAHPVSANPMKN